MKGLRRYEEENIRKAAALIKVSMPVYPGTKALCKEACMGQNKLLAEFTCLFGMPPYRYYMQQRFQKAREMLSDGRLTIDSVADELGYSWSSAFIRAFRKLLGCTHGAFLKRENNAELSTRI